MYDAVVLAGGKLQETLSYIGEVPMLSHVVNALQASSSVDQIIVAGPPALEALRFSERVMLTSGGDSILATLTAGIRAAAMPERILIATADIPFLTAEAVDDFVAECGGADDFYYPVIEKAQMQARFPNGRRTYVRLRNGVFTGGNLFLAKTDILPRCCEAARRITDNRKKPWRLAAMLGWMNLLKFACGRLSLEEAQEAAGRLLAVRARVVCTSYAEIGMDVDKPEDLALARAYFAQK